MRTKSLPLLLIILILISSVFLILFSFTAVKTISFPDGPITSIQEVFFTKIFAQTDPKQEKIIETTTQNVDDYVNKLEMNALSDQFKTPYPQSSNLLPARVIGFVNYIPSVSEPTGLIINRGSEDKVARGQVIVSSGFLVGIVDQVSSSRSKIRILNDNNLKLTGSVLNKDIDGLIVAHDDELFFENVLIADDLKQGDLIVTKGDQNLEGSGVPPDLVIGTIESVDKSENELFQTGKIKSDIDTKKLRTVFVYFP